MTSNSDAQVHSSLPGGVDCTFCDGYGWLYEQPANVKAPCPMCKGSGRWVSEQPAAGPSEAPPKESP
jgi:DnaJ-class molecular chaperone